MLILVEMMQLIGDRFTSNMASCMVNMKSGSLSAIVGGVDLAAHDPSNSPQLLVESFRCLAKATVLNARCNQDLGPTSLCFGSPYFSRVR